MSERAARRYIEILREAGVAIESSRGRYGGYQLGRGTRLPPVAFTQDEALGLVMAVLEGHPAATDTDELVGSALTKVIRVLPEKVGRQAAALSRLRGRCARSSCHPSGPCHYEHARCRRGIALPSPAAVPERSRR